MLDITLEQIETVLGQKGRRTSRDYVFQCPVCMDSGKNNLVFTPEKGLLKCFSCSNNEGGQYVLDLINKKYADKPKPIHKPVVHEVPKWEIMQEQYLLYMCQSQQELLSNDTLLDYLNLKRGLTKEIVELVGLGFDSEANQFVLPIFGLKEKCIVDFELRAYGDRKIISRVGGGHNTIALIYGGYEGKILYLCEGLIDGYVLTQFLREKGQKDFAVYSCSNGASSLINVLPAINFSAFEQIKLMLDADGAGTKATNDIIENYAFIKDARKFLFDSNCKDFCEWYLKKGV